MIFLLNVLATVFGVIILAVLIFAIALVRASSRSVSSRDDIEQKVKDALRTASRIQFKAEMDINKLYIQAMNAINTATEGKLPDDVSAYELIDNFNAHRDKLKTVLSPELLERVDKLIAGYKAQIAIKKQEVKMAQELEKKYLTLSFMIEQAKKEKKISDRLASHEQRLEQMQGNLSSQKQLIEQAYSYDMIEKEVNQKVEYLRALEQLQAKYDSPDLITDTSQYQRDLDQISKQFNG